MRYRNVKLGADPGDSIEAITQRDRAWRERQEQLGHHRPDFYSATNAARGARDRLILLRYFTAVQLQMAYLKLLASIHQTATGHPLLPTLQAKADEVWRHLSRDEQAELELLLSELDLFHLHRPRRH